ncbi:MAG: hypothetical protein M3Q07_05690 [Pseudobdellovibrionaceae bacterium]|nr:hypothetical protein [Pseudobdellovibrionaceae bacterium]
MLLEIRGQLETCLGLALPDFNKFSARVTRISTGDLPFVNIYFHRDTLMENQNHYENREVRFEIECCFVAEGDAEKELVSVRQKIEAAVESSKKFDDLVTDWLLDEVDFGHDMVGEKRIAALSMTYRIQYQKPCWLPPEPTLPKHLYVNGVKEDVT